jgi:hypothetical protein
VAGNGVRLIWASRGPGWPADGGSTWQPAAGACARLKADGAALTADWQRTWGLPTVEEAVRSMVRDGGNAGGTWDPSAARAEYAVQPDKESPLWDVYSPVIYWWTSTEVDARHAHRIAYNGHVVGWPKISIRTT